MCSEYPCPTVTYETSLLFSQFSQLIRKRTTLIIVVYYFGRLLCVGFLFPLCSGNNICQVFFRCKKRLFHRNPWNSVKTRLSTCLCKRSQWKTTIFAKYQKFRWTILFASPKNLHVNWRNLAHAQFMTSREPSKDGEIPKRLTILPKNSFSAKMKKKNAISYPLHCAYITPYTVLLENTFPLQEFTRNNSLVWCARIRFLGG